MVNRFIRTLPIKPTGNYTLKIIAEIKAIPNDDITYTRSEIRWMRRALELLDWFEVRAEKIVINKTYPNDTGVDVIFTIHLHAADYTKLRREQITEQLRIAIQSRTLRFRFKKFRKKVKKFKQKLLTD